MSEPKTFIERCYKDKNGRVTLFQKPNAPLVVWLLCILLQKVVVGGKPHTAFGLIGFGALFTWAWLEIFQGSNYFRRILGLVILSLAVIARVK